MGTARGPRVRREGHLGLDVAGPGGQQCTSNLDCRESGSNKISSAGAKEDTGWQPLVPKQRALPRQRLVCLLPHELIVLFTIKAGWEGASSLQPL